MQFPFDLEEILKWSKKIKYNYSEEQKVISFSSDAREKNKKRLLKT
jgi:hypothetical protein